LYKKLKRAQHYCFIGEISSKDSIKNEKMKMKLFLGVSITRSQEKKEEKFVILPN